MTEIRKENRDRRAQNNALTLAVFGEKSFAGKVAKLLAIMDGPGGAPMTRIAEVLDATGREGSKKIYTALRDLCRANKALRVSPGFYRAVRPAAGRITCKNEVMWRLLRAKRTLTVEDIQALSSVSEAYAREWLRALTHRGIVVKERNGAFRLVRDLGPKPPDLAGNAEKCAAWREKQKVLLAEAFKQIEFWATEARKASGELSKEGDHAGH
jgi:hypothetical protein